MTRTIKLSREGGITFDKNGRLEMIGEPNKISLEEVKQRTSIRFLTQKRFNILHPAEGFDYLILTEINANGDGYRVPPETLLVQEIVGTLAQDRDIQYEDNEIKITLLPERTYKAVVRYGIKGDNEKVLEFKGSIGAIK